MTRTQGQGGGDAERAETYLRLMAESRLRRARRYPRARYAAPPVLEDLRQVRAVAAALVSAGVLDEARAWSVVQGLEADLGAGSRAGPGLLQPRPGTMGPGTRAAAPALPAGPLLAVPAGAAVPHSQPGEDAGRDAWRPLAFVLAPDGATLTLAAPLRRPGTGQHAGPSGMNEPGSRPAATDDRGASYRLQFSGGDSFDMIWSAGQFELSPPVPPGARWLEVSMAPGAGPLRVDLTTPPAPTGAGTRPATPTGEHVLDTIAENILWRSVATGRRGDHPLTEFAEMVAGLEAAGALQPGSPAAARLAALARRLGIGLPTALPARAPADLPERWASVLTERDRRDGPVGVAPAAAVLPEVDGARFALAGLHSAAESATLRALAWGWAPYGGPLRPPLDRFVWQAHDDAGRWHVAGLAGSGDSGQHADLYLTLVPPLDPAATSLKVIVTGRAGRACATVPLDWQGVP
jgi:hypothetical protein